MIEFSFTNVLCYFRTNLSPLSYFHRDCEDGRKQHLFVWLYYMTGCPTMFLSFLWLYHQHDLSIKDRRTLVLQSKLFTRKYKQIMGKDKINFWSLAVTNKESSASTLHQPLKHTYICTLSMRKRGKKRNKITLLSLHFVNLQSLQNKPVSEKREMGDKGGRIKH